MMKTWTPTRWLVLVALLSLRIDDGDSSEHQWSVDGTVLELTESNFDSVISAFDHVLVDFHAPWCGHCKRLSPQLDIAAPALAALKEPIVIAKVDADKYTRLAKKYDIDGFPTLKLFMHGVPVGYNGPRKADLLVRYLKKFVAPDVSVLDSDSAISEFVEAAGTYFPIYIGFGLDESVISNLALKYKKKAWFAVAKDFSEDAMVLYDFDKTPALVVIHPNYNEHRTFYGPFEDDFLENFVKHNLFPLALPISIETLKSLGDDERKIVLTIVEDQEDDKSKKLIKILRSAASANHDLVFGFVGIKQWEDFADTFGAKKDSKLPRMVVWNRNEEYLTVIDSEYMDDNDDQATQVSRFLDGYRKGRTIQEKINGPSVLGFINSLIGVRMVYIIVFIVAVIMVIQALRGDEEPLRVGTRDPADHPSSSPLVSGADAKEESSGKKED